MKNKYYYNGKLVRTSENEYKYGVVVGEDHVISCHQNKELAQKQLHKTINEYNKRIVSDRKYLEKNPLATTTLYLIARRIKELDSLRIVELEVGDPS